MLRKALIIVWFLAMSSYAATFGPIWTTNGISLPAIATQANANFISNVNMGNDKYIAVWAAQVNNDMNIYAQIFDGNGAMVGSTIPICTASGTQNRPKVVADGSGGAIIIWRDKRVGNDNYQVYGQKVDATGAIKWTANGRALTKGAEKDYVYMIGDGAGGFYLTYADMRNNTDYGIYGQSYNSSGAPIWSGSSLAGITIYDVAGDQIKPKGVMYGANNKNDGMIVVFEDTLGTDTDRRIKAVNVTVGGVVGAPVEVANWKYAKNASIFYDGSSYIFIASEVSNQPESHYAIHGQKLDLSMTKLWGLGKYIMYSSSPYLLYPQAISDGAGGMVVVWSHGPGYTDDNKSFDIYMQKLDSQGEPQLGSIAAWGGRTGVPLCNATGMQLLAIGNDDNDFLNNKVLQSTADNCAVVAWYDYRRDTTATYSQTVDLKMEQYLTWKEDVYSQKFRISDGAVLGPANGAPVSTGLIGFPWIASDGSNGAVLSLLYVTSANWWPYIQKMVDLSGITSIIPAYGPPGTAVTLTGATNAIGSDPKTYIGDPLYGGSMNKVEFDNNVIPAADITSWANNAIETKVPAGAAGPHTFKVTAYGGEYSADFVVPGAEPQITGVKFDSKFYYTPRAGEYYYINTLPEITAAITPSLTSATITTLKVVVDGIEYDALSGYVAATGQLTYKLLSSLTEGAHTISIRAIDLYGLTATQSYPVNVQSSSAGVTNVPSAVGYPGGKSFFNPTGAVAAGVSAKAASMVTIAYTLPSAVPVDLKLYGSSGGVLWGQSIPSGAAGASVGYNELTWDGRDVTGQYVGTGIYPYQIVSGGKVISRGHIVVSYQSQ